MGTGPAARTERLMCLVFILKARGRRGITKSELRRSVDAYLACPSDEAFERMLERDKHDLRDVGIRIRTEQRDAYHEDEFAYVLDTESLLTLPPLDSEEMRVLALAARAWERGTWDAMANGALHKLEVFGPEPAQQASPRVTVSMGPHLEELRAAVRERQRVQFAYRRPGDAQALPRTVEPWGLLARDGAWYCVGYDVDRGAGRVFRTSRIAGDIQRNGAAVQPVDPEWATLPQTDPAALESAEATLLIVPGHGWTWRNAGTVTGTRSVGGRMHDVVTVDVSGSRKSIGALAAAAPHVRVLAPADLCARVEAHLTELAHG